MRSVVRPVQWRKPSSSTKPASPVWKKPSASKVWSRLWMQDADRVAGQDLSLRAVADIRGRVRRDRRDDRERFGEPVGGARAPRVLGDVDARVAAERAKRFDVPHGREIGGLPVGMLLELCKLMRPRVRCCDAFLVEQPQSFAGGEGFLQHQAAAGRKCRSHHHRETGRPEQREGAPRAHVTVEAQVPYETPALQARRCVRTQNALRNRGRPRCVDDDGIIYRCDRGCARVEIGLRDPLAG